MKAYNLLSKNVFMIVNILFNFADILRSYTPNNSLGNVTRANYRFAETPLESGLSPQLGHQISPPV
jgi:hypothetical protein